MRFRSRTSGGTRDLPGLAALLLEAGRLQAARDYDLAFDHGAFGDRDRVPHQAAADAARAGDLDAPGRDHVPVHLSGDDDVCGPDRSGPPGAGRERHGAVDVAVAVDAAAEHVRSRAGDAPDALRGG